MWKVQCLLCGLIKTISSTSFKRFQVQKQKSCHHRRHGLSYRPEYRVWYGIIQRCYNPSARGYKNYGRRGIAVCDAWRDSVANFVRDMGRWPSKSFALERIDNDGNYEPDNCKWTTRKERTNDMRDGLSRQYRWQLKMRRQNRCYCCGRPSVRANLCIEHWRVRNPLRIRRYKMHSSSTVSDGQI